MVKKYVYFFGAGRADGNKDMKDILGGKGANLAEMAGLGLPVPPGFTISTEVCDLFYKTRKRIPADVRKEVGKNLARSWKRPSDRSLVTTRIPFSFPSAPAPGLRCRV